MRQDMYGVIWILIRTKEIAFEKILQSNMHKITNKQYEEYQNLLDGNRTEEAYATNYRKQPSVAVFFWSITLQNLIQKNAASPIFSQ